MGSIFGELGALCATCLPGIERVEAVGNSFGRGPLVYWFRPSAVEALRERCVESVTLCCDRHGLAERGMRLFALVLCAVSIPLV